MFFTYTKLTNPESMLWGRVRIFAITIALWGVYRMIPCRMTRLCRIIVQMALLSWWYPDTYEFNRMFPNLDHLFAAYEQYLFGCQPALLFSQVFSNSVFSELMCLADSRSDNVLFRAAIQSVCQSVVHNTRLVLHLLHHIHNTAGSRSAILLQRRRTRSDSTRCVSRRRQFLRRKPRGTRHTGIHRRYILSDGGRRAQRRRTPHGGIPKQSCRSDDNTHDTGMGQPQSPVVLLHPAAVHTAVPVYRIYICALCDRRFRRLGFCRGHLRPALFRI